MTGTVEEGAVHGLARNHAFVFGLGEPRACRRDCRGAGKHRWATSSSRSSPTARSMPAIWKACAAQTCFSCSRCVRANGYDVNDALMELLIMADAAKRASARTVSAVVDPLRLCAPGPQGRLRASPSAAKLVADLLAVAGRGQRHRHRPAPGRHPGLLRPAGEPHDGHAHLRGLLQEQGASTPTSLCVVSPDVGRAKAAKKFSHDAGLRPRHHAQGPPQAQPGRDHRAHRRRDRQDLHPQRRHDRHRAARSWPPPPRSRPRARPQVYACATHGLFSGPAYERIENSPIEEVVVTNAVPVPLARQTGKVKVLSRGAAASRRPSATCTPTAASRALFD